MSKPGDTPKARERWDAGLGEESTLLAQALEVTSTTPQALANRLGLSRARVLAMVDPGARNATVPLRVIWLGGAVGDELLRLLVQRCQTRSRMVPLAPADLHAQVTRALHRCVLTHAEHLATPLHVDRTAVRQAMRAARAAIDLLEEALGGE